MKQKTIPFEVHQLPLDKIDQHALYVMDKLRAAGFVAYLVGGSVRDLLLNHKPKDFDISTSAKPEEIKKIFRNCILIGRRFRLAHIRFGSKILEVSTFRAGDPEKDELILRDNQWGEPEEDALRRDFTINGLFYDSSDQSIIDYVDGYKDLQRRHLRSIGQAFLRFKQDPVRMLRLLKFQARFGLAVDPDDHIALLECRQEIIKSSPARVLEEILRMLESGAAKPFIELITNHGLMSHLIPDIASFIEKEKEGADIYSYLLEIDRIFQDPTSEKLDRAILLSALTFPLFQKRIKTLYLDRDQIPHLGQIQQQAQHLIDEMYLRYLHLPRRIKISMIQILSSQYRLTPLHKKRLGRPRVPGDPDFLLALQFLSLRTCLEPALQVVYEEWMTAASNTEFDSPAPTQRRPRKRRRRRKPPTE